MTGTAAIDTHPFESPIASATRSLDSFPEDRFLPTAEHRDAYDRRVHLGYQRMQQQRVVIAGLARNIAAVLPTTIARMERLGSLFCDYRVVVFENDSSDGTLANLHDWACTNQRVAVLNHGYGDPVHPTASCPHRADRMAAYRGQYWQYIADHCCAMDTVVVADTDLAGGWSYDGIANTFGHDHWDSVGSYGIIYKRRGWQPNQFVQYDAWAYRTSMSFDPLSVREVNFMRFQRGEPLVPVRCCFGGLAIYQMPAFLSGRYSGGDCEHVGLHRSMAKAGYRRSYLNPSQITVYGRRRRTWDPLFRLGSAIGRIVLRTEPDRWLEN